MTTPGEHRTERSLAAILAADVAGYSRLTGVDEEGTHVQLRDHLRLLVDPKIAEHRGRVVKNTGDGLLAEFSSVVDAVRCAVDVQRGMVERNADVPQERRIEFRIVINVGDIIIDRGDIERYAMSRDTTVVAFRQPEAIDDPLSELAREGARRMLAQVLIAEADSFVAMLGKPR